MPWYRSIAPKQKIVNEPQWERFYNVKSKQNLVKKVTVCLYLYETEKCFKESKISFGNILVPWTGHLLHEYKITLHIFIKKNIFKFTEISMATLHIELWFFDILRFIVIPTGAFSAKFSRSLLPNYSRKCLEILQFQAEYSHVAWC